MEYVLHQQYQSFITEQIIEQSIMERYINECVLMESSKNTVKNIILLNESVSDKIKSAFRKILEAIGRMWGKFLESMNNLLNSNRAYLEKYKDIILKKKLNPNATYRMYNYAEGIKRMMQTPVPILNYASMEKNLADEKQFIASVPTLSKIVVKDSDATFADQAKAYFRGSADVEDIPSGRLNMTDIFNYCYEYDNKIKPLLEKDLNEIKNAANQAADMIDKAERDAKKYQPTQTQGQPQQQSQNQAQPQNNATQESVLFGEKSYYSHVYEAYIHELEINYGETSKTNKDSSIANNMNNKTGDKPSSDTQKAAIKNDTSSYDDKIKKVQTYLNICGAVLAAKQTIAEEIFKEYMQIIKAHIRDHVGTSKKDTSNDKIADAGTNYKNMVNNALSGKNNENNNNNNNTQ